VRSNVNNPCLTLRRTFCYSLGSAPIMPVESSLSLEDSDDGESSGDNQSVEDEQE